jgi:hypothetical protein
MATMTRLSLALDPMGISHFHLFFWNHKTDLNQTWQKCSLDGHIQDFVFGADQKSNMVARAHNVFWLVEIFKIFLLETTKPIELWLCRNDHWVVLYLICELFADRKFKIATITRLSSTLDPMGISHFHLFFWNHKTDLNQTWQKCLLDGHIQDFVFGADQKSNMAARAHNVFWLVEIFKIFLLETTKPIELWLCRNDHWVVLY